MKPLKLKKVKISRIGNPHRLFGGAEAPPTQGEHPITYTLDTLLDDTCIPGTNGGSIGKTGIRAANADSENERPVNEGSQN